MITELPTETLTREQENNLARAKTEEAQNTLVLHSMREAIAYAYKCCRGGLTQDELFSLCYEYLQVAVKRFKPNRIRFFSYAKVDIRRGIAQTWRAKDVVRGSSLHEDEDFIKPNRESGLREDGDTDENLGPSQIYNPITEITESPEIFVEPEFEKIHLAERWGLVAPILRAKLTDTEFMVIDLYYNGNLVLREIGELLDITRERVRQIESEALKTIRLELMRRKLLYSE